MIAVNAKPNGYVTPCQQCPLRRLPCLREFAPDELEFVQRFKSDELHFEAGATFLREGSKSDHLFTVLSGWAFRYKVLDDGRRQILNLRCQPTWSACRARSWTRWSIRSRR